MKGLEGEMGKMGIWRTVHMRMLMGSLALIFSSFNTLNQCTIMADCASINRAL